MLIICNRESSIEYILDLQLNNVYVLREVLFIFEKHLFNLRETKSQKKIIVIVFLIIIVLDLEK